MKLQVMQAKLIAWLFHLGQKDLGGTPYFEHCKFVAKEARFIGSRFTECEEILDKIEVLGYLHDILEDTRIPLWLLSCLFSDETVIDIRTLTRTKGSHYLNYIRQCSTSINTAIVKLADVNHNLDTTRLPENWKAKKTLYNRMKKYVESRLILLDSLDKR